MHIFRLYKLIIRYLYCILFVEITSTYQRCNNILIQNVLKSRHAVSKGLYLTWCNVKVQCLLSVWLGWFTSMFQSQKHLQNGVNSLSKWLLFCEKKTLKLLFSFEYNVVQISPACGLNT